MILKKKKWKSETSNRRKFPSNMTFSLKNRHISNQRRIFKIFFGRKAVLSNKIFQRAFMPFPFALPKKKFQRSFQKNLSKYFFSGIWIVQVLLAFWICSRFRKFSRILTSKSIFHVFSSHKVWIKKIYDGKLTMKFGQ